VALPLPGLYNVYNALGAAALCLSLGLAPVQIAEGLEHVRAAFGRSERIALGSHELSVLLIKNPAGANEVLRTLQLEPDGLDVLGILNDRTADGRDVSWIWDADFELLAPTARRITCSGTRAAELALRFKYAGVDEARLHVQPDLATALDGALAGAASSQVFALPTYTALLELRAELGRRGHVESFWETPRR
jgi:lipid II isoglutaminyl synthase (glutamine-hydrolysing)